MASMSGNKRMVHYDLLRILAAFSVVMLHSAAQFWYKLPVTETEWKIANTYDALFRFGVPIFVMISGVLFLGREVNVKKLYTHNILRLAIIYVIWSAAYGFYDCTRFDMSQMGWKAIMQEIVTGRYHLWFLPMIVGIYMLLPILHSWIRTADKKNLQYFLFLFLVIKIGMNTVLVLQKNEIVNFVVGFFNVSELAMACSYIGYFVLGYYIVFIGIPKNWHKVIYVAAVPSAILNIVLDYYMAMEANAPVGILYDSFGVFTFIIVLALFLFFAEVMSRVHYSNFASSLIQEISKGTLGIYVMHLGVIEILEKQGIHSMLIPNVVGIPVLAIGTFIICFLLAAVLRRIPVIGKYIC